MGLFSRTPNSLEIDVHEAHALQAEGATLVDIRESWEWAQGRAAGARHMPLGQIAIGMQRLPRDKPVLLICASGNLGARQPAAPVLGAPARPVPGGKAPPRATTPARSPRRRSRTR